MVHIIALLMFSPSSPHGVLSTLTPTVSGIDTAGETNGNVAAIPDAEIRDVEAKHIYFLMKQGEKKYSGVHG